MTKESILSSGNVDVSLFLDSDHDFDRFFAHFSHSLTGKVKGQATLELLSAYALAQYPLDLVVTDGHKYHILRIRGRKIICWEDLTTAQAMHHLASFLKEADVSVDLEVATDEGRVKEDEGIQALLSMRKYRASAARVSSLLFQVSFNYYHALSIVSA